MLSWDFEDSIDGRDWLARANFAIGQYHRRPGRENFKNHPEGTMDDGGEFRILSPKKFPP